MPKNLWYLQEKIILFRQFQVGGTICIQGNPDDTARLLMTLAIVQSYSGREFTYTRQSVSANILFRGPKVQLFIIHTLGKNLLLPQSIQKRKTMMNVYPKKTK